MTSVANRTALDFQRMSLRVPSDEFYAEPHWFAVYTRANHEKIVTEKLFANSVKHYLPLFESVRRWKDRNKLLSLPLFPGYVFVHLALIDRLHVLQIPGVVRIVGCGNHPEPMSEADISAIRAFSETNCRVRPHRFLKAGCRVRVARGALAGLDGILIREKNDFRLVLSIAFIMRSVSVEIDRDDVEPTS